MNRKISEEIHLKNGEFLVVGELHRCEGFSGEVIASNNYLKDIGKFILGVRLFIGLDSEGSISSGGLESLHRDIDLSDPICVGGYFVDPRTLKERSLAKGEAIVRLHPRTVQSHAQTYIDKKLEMASQKFEEGIRSYRRN